MLGLDLRIILKWSSRNRVGDADWIDLALVREKCRALVYAVMNLRVPENAGRFIAS